MRDFALLTVAAQLTTAFPNSLVFKGGFVLRHVHGILRFSKDADATGDAPPQSRLDADAVANAIKQASIGDMVRFDPGGGPATDSANSLDFDHIEVSGSLFPPSDVQVEISYREAVIDKPDEGTIGAPFSEEFVILAMTLPEMASEKLRTLAQRSRSTDLADLAVILTRNGPDDQHIGELAQEKFKLVARGAANRVQRIGQRLKELAADYDDQVPVLFPEAPSYHEALDIVWPRIKPLIP